MISHLGNGIVAPQDRLKCLGIWSELPIDEDLVRALGRWGMTFVTLAGYDTVAAVKNPSRCPK